MKDNENNQDIFIKVMGKNNDTFIDTVMGIIQQHFKDYKKYPVTQQLSKEGNYLSLTIKVTPESQEQMDAAYQALSQSPDVIMTL